MKRRLRFGRIVVVAAIAALVVGALPDAVGAVTLPRSVPKVVFIVGPAGGATPYYQKLADEAAAAASRLTSSLAKVYSPDATWEAVKAATTGASILVYLGHGNGWPSPYRDSLYPTTQNGLGLNPHAGAANVHQYFGEDRIAAELKLAPNAVVIFSHLCYASGNSEPGLAEGTLDQAQQRVDNYAAGFLRAGASAVIADAYLSPTYYVSAILAGKGSVESIWRSAPNANGNWLRFDSNRTKGHVAEMDPDTADSGFHRSLVARPRLTVAQVLAGAVRRPGEVVPAFEPTLIGLGLTFGSPNLASPPTAGSASVLSLPVAKAVAALLPKGVMLGTRWDPLDAPVESSPAASSPAAASPADDLVSPERPGEVVAPVAAKPLKSGGLSVPVRIPSTPGLYRLVATIHGADGLAFDAATQALVPALVVRVIGPQTAAYGVASSATAVADTTLDLPVRITNIGTDQWGRPAFGSRGGRGREGVLDIRAVLVGHWVGLDGTVVESPTPAGRTTAWLPAGLKPGASVDLDFQPTAPHAAGVYLLVLDVEVPGTGSLAATGVPPAIVRVTVGG